jgi:hypothetical protein
MKVNLPVRSVLLSLILGPTDSSRLNFLSLDAPQQYNTPRCSFSPQKLFCSPVDIPGFFLTNSHKTDYFIDKEEKNSRLAGYACTPLIRQTRRRNTHYAHTLKLELKL